MGPNSAAYCPGELVEALPLRSSSPSTDLSLSRHPSVVCASSQSPTSEKAPSTRRSISAPALDGSDAENCEEQGGGGSEAEGKEKGLTQSSPPK